MNRQNDCEECEYNILIKSHLDEKHSLAFWGLQITHLDNGTTLISGHIRDQSALFGVLLRIRDMGIELISVQRKHENEDPLPPMEAK